MMLGTSTLLEAIIGFWSRNKFCVNIITCLDNNVNKNAKLYLENENCKELKLAQKRGCHGIPFTTS
jgi:hypothetical protein